MTTWKSTDTKNLAKALTSITSEKEMLSFLRDVATLEELEALAIRWKAAQLLYNGDTYRTVAKKTGVSTTTVTRVAHWLHKGEGGYKALLEK